MTRCTSFGCKLFGIRCQWSTVVTAQAKSSHCDPSRISRNFHRDSVKSGRHLSRRSAIIVRRRCRSSSASALVDEISHVAREIRKKAEWASGAISSAFSSTHAWQEQRQSKSPQSVAILSASCFASLAVVLACLARTVRVAYSIANSTSKKARGLMLFG